MTEDDAPPHNLADLFELGNPDATVTEQKREELEAVLERIKSGEFEPPPGEEPTIRVIKTLLENTDG